MNTKAEFVVKLFSSEPLGHQINLLVRHLLKHLP